MSYSFLKKIQVSRRGAPPLATRCSSLKKTLHETFFLRIHLTAFARLRMDCRKNAGGRADARFKFCGAALSVFGQPDDENQCTRSKLYFRYSDCLYALGEADGALQYVGLAMVGRATRGRRKNDRTRTRGGH